MPTQVGEDAVPVPETVGTVHVPWDVVTKPDGALTV
jgi:hypothetical protein